MALQATAAADPAAEIERASKIRKKCSEESCPTTMFEHIAEQEGATLDDLINFLFKATYNPALMKGILEKGVACWGTFQPLQDYGIMTKGPSRTLVATNPTDNKYREDRRATIPIRNIIITINAFLKRIHHFHEVSLEVKKEDFVQGRLFLVIRDKQEMTPDNEEEAAKLGATVTKLTKITACLNTYAGKINWQRKEQVPKK